MIIAYIIVILYIIFCINGIIGCTVGWLLDDEQKTILAFVHVCEYGPIFAIQIWPMWAAIVIYLKIKGEW